MASFKGFLNISIFVHEPCNGVVLITSPVTSILIKWYILVGMLNAYHERCATVRANHVARFSTRLRYEEAFWSNIRYEELLGVRDRRTSCNKLRWCSVHTHMLYQNAFDVREGTVINGKDARDRRCNKGLLDVRHRRTSYNALIWCARQAHKPW